ncbi:MAG: hypothetical protein ABIH26_09650, partial [Candidatus Eisenbacteria bacterium]
MRVLTNCRRLPRGSSPASGVLIDFVPFGRAGLPGGVRFFAKSLSYDVVVLYQPGKELLLFCALKALARVSRPRLAVVDLVFSLPRRSAAGRMMDAVKRLLWRHVDLFLLHVRDVSGLSACWGVPESKCRYIPFKVNSLDRIAGMKVREGDYVFTGGRSRRDFHTFGRAMEGLPCRGIILTPDARLNEDHGTTLDGLEIPKNVELVRDDGSSESWIRHIASSKFVVFCIAPNAVGASGVGAYLLAMALDKCVVITDCPAARGILTDGEEAVIVPP